MEHPAIAAGCTPSEVETFDKIAAGVGSYRWTIAPDGNVTAREPLPRSVPISGADFASLKAKGFIDYLVEFGGHVEIDDAPPDGPKLYNRCDIVTPHLTMDADFAYRRWKLRQPL